MKENLVMLFISHSKKDKELADLLIKTIKTFFDIQDQYIRCTSLPGYQLSGGANIAATLQNELKNSEEDQSIRRLVSLAETYSPDIKTIPVSCLYSLLSSSEKVRNDTEIFQDFNVSRIKGSNNNPVHHFWADTFTNSSIKALIMKNMDENYLRVWFDNGERTEQQGEQAIGWASNIMIHPQHLALGNEKEEGGLKHNCLRFYVRIPQEEMNGQYINEVGISLRLLDRRLTYWVYKTILRGTRPTQFKVTNTTWQEFTINLLPEYFSIFESDGNKSYLKYNNNNEPCPDFTILAGVTFVLGSFTSAQEESREGKGVIDIKDIRLADC